MVPLVVRYDPRWHKQLVSLKRQLTAGAGRLGKRTQVILAYKRNKKLVKVYKA